MVRLLCVTLFLLVQAQWSIAATINTRVDAEEVSVDESFRVVFETSTPPNGPPDYTVLEQDFDVLRKNESSSMQTMNGQFTRQWVWVVTLAPKREGELTIPPVPFGSDLSRIRTVRVLASEPLPDGEEPELFFEIDAQPEELYVQQNLLYTVRLYRSVVVGNSRIGHPELKEGDAIVERLDDGRSFEQIRKGKRHVVVERSYAIFPQQSGPMTINPIVFEGQVIERNALPRLKRLRSQAVSLNVKPIPQGFSGSVWLPSSDLTITEDWSSQTDVLTAGEPVTWTLTLRANGLTSTQLPDFQLEWDQKINAYPDQAQLRDRVAVNGIVGERQQKIALIATEPGEYVLPVVELVWWNTKTDRQETASLEGRSIRVLAAPGGADRVDIAPPPVAREQEAPPRPRPSTAAPSVQNEPVWSYWTPLLLGIGWLLTALAWFVSSRGASVGSAIEAPDDGEENTGVLRNQLQGACKAGQPADAKKVLLQLARVYWPDGSVSTLGDMAKHYEQPLRGELEALSQAVYCGRRESWQGMGLWQSWRGCQHGVADKDSKTVGHEALHPLVGI